MTYDTIGRPTAVDAKRFFATIVSSRADSRPNQAGLSRSHIIASIEAGPRRLNLDFIDLYRFLNSTSAK